MKPSDNYMPFHEFDAESWAKLRADTPMTLGEDDLKRLRGINEKVNIEEVEQIYLPVSRLLNLYVGARRQLYKATSKFLNNGNANGSEQERVPFIIGIAGSVAVGKSTTARVLRELLAAWDTDLKVELLNTDGFLQPNAWLEAKGMMDKKGFPKSYNRACLLEFLSDIKAGKPNVKAPTYSHLTYDIVPDQFVTYDRPDILIVEGINVLQSGVLPKGGEAIPYVSDFFDFSIFIDAEEELIGKWYIDRFLGFRKTAFADPNAYFHKYAAFDDAQAVETATMIWQSINRKNLRENILPTRPRADLILKKGSDHFIEQILLRKI
ncbi:MAG: type I pantothenate kinase [Hyphomicrobiales bacterium]|nr:MAG: type I pantothenate kinase [Hyphomicrobiales bacterium]